MTRHQSRGRRRADTQNSNRGEMVASQERNDQPKGNVSEPKLHRPTAPKPVEGFTWPMMLGDPTDWVGLPISDTHVDELQAG